MVIVVPAGDDSDPTRNHAYDTTYEFLNGLGLETI